MSPEREPKSEGAGSPPPDVYSVLSSSEKPQVAPWIAQKKLPLPVSLVARYSSENMRTAMRTVAAVRSSAWPTRPGRLDVLFVTFDSGVNAAERAGFPSAPSGR